MSSKSDFGHPLLSTSLRYFLAVAETGSVSRAAARLCVASSAVSRQIAKLEELLGGRLFDRRPRGMVLSSAGERVAAYARTLGADAKCLAEELRGRPAEPMTVRLAYTDGFANWFIPAVIEEYQRMFRDTQFDLYVGSPKEVTERVTRGESDLGIKYSMTPENGTIVEYSLQAPVYAFVGASHPLAVRTAVSLIDVLAYPIAISGPATTVRQLFDRCCVSERRYVEPAVVSNTLAGVTPMLKESNIIILAGYLAIRPDRHQGAVAVLPFTNPEMRRRNAIVISNTATSMTAPVDSFKKHLNSALKKFSAPYLTSNSARGRTCRGTTAIGSAARS
jgi:DNA-binding transcriptional LysR family regulator